MGVPGRPGGPGGPYPRPGGPNNLILNRPVNINSLNVRPAWVGPGWGAARPWGGWGWYGRWSTPPWGWWAANTALWGITALTSAAILESSVNGAISNNSPMIVVPNSTYELLYGTVQPIQGDLIQFAATQAGLTYPFQADCRSGLLNGQQPVTAAEAELLNAACYVAFGST